MSRRIGTLVGLGSPTDRITPFGAARRYASDALWQTDLIAAARRARCILAVPAVSAGTDWEFTELRRLGLHHKMFLLTPPGSPDDSSEPAMGRAVGLILAIHRGWFRRLIEVARHGVPVHPDLDRRWPAVSAQLSRSGYDAGPDPGPGAVVAFGSRGEAAVLCRGAVDARDYTAVIVRRLALSPPA